MENKLPDSETNCSACYEIAIDGATKFKHTCGLEKTYNEWEETVSQKEFDEVIADGEKYAVSSWEEKFYENFIPAISKRKSKYVQKQIKFIRQTIKTEREQAVRDRDSEWVITSTSLIKKARQQAVKEVKDEIEYLIVIHKQLSKEIVGSNDYHLGAIFVLENLKGKINKNG